MFRTSLKAVFLILAGICILASGCTGGGPSTAGKAILLSTEPENASNVIDFKSKLITGLGGGGEEVIVGRVSTAGEPWDVTQATFLLRDMNSTTEAHEHDGGDHSNCKFCQAEKAKELESMALVRVIDENGDIVKADARKLLGLKEDHVVVAKGQGQIDDDGAFVFDAVSVFIRP